MLLDRLEKWYEVRGRKLIRILVGFFLVYVFLKYILRLVAPFIIAWLFATLLNPVVTWLNRRAKLPRGTATLLSMLTVLSAVIGSISFIIKQLWDQIIAFSNAFPLYKEDIAEVLGQLENNLLKLMQNIPLPKAFTSIEGMITEVLDTVSKFLGKLAPFAYDIVSKVPKGIFFFIVMLIATFFMTKDNAFIREFIVAQLPEALRSKSRIVQKGLKNAVGGYIKTQLILMCFTFIICLIGLFLLRREYILLISLVIGIVDALPVFGSGSILIPWAIYNLIIGEYGVGIGLLSIYGLIVVMRQIMEPKVLSHQIGVYALVTVMSMYIGFKLIGAFGIIIGPIVAVIFQTLQRVGVIPPFKEPHKKV